MSKHVKDLIQVPIIESLDSDENCNKIIYLINSSGLLQLNVLPSDLTSPPKQITNEKESIFGGMISPKGDKVVYPLDEGGNERPHLYLLPLEGGECKKISTDPYRTLAMAWHPDGNEISRSIISMKGYNIETFNLKSEENFMLLEGISPIYSLNYSHDGKWIACTQIKSIKDTQVIIFNRKDPSDSIIYNIKDNTRDGMSSWAPDDSKLAIFSEATGRMRVYIQEFQAEKRYMLDLEPDEDANANMGELAWDPKGKKVYYVVSKHGRSILHAHPLDGSIGNAFPFPEGQVLYPKLSKDGLKLVAIHSSMKDPYGIYLHEVGSETIIPLTSREFEIDIDKLEKPTSICYKSFDGLDIHAWYLPAATRKTPHPAIIIAHGGPWSQVSDSWTYGVLGQIFSQNGIAVLYPNFRGSTGYGSEFQNLDLGDPGGGDLEDVVYGAKWLQSQSEIDPSKLGITGGSYGGYMTLMALGKKPDVFIAGVARVPVVDWIHKLKLIDPFQALNNITLFGGKPKKELKQLYIDRSPITHVSSMKAPVMIIAGKNDIRCPLPPIENFIQKLKEKNHPYEFLLIEDAGHISAGYNWEESVPMFKRMIEFLIKYLI